MRCWRAEGELCQPGQPGHKTGLHSSATRKHSPALGQHLTFTRLLAILSQIFTSFLVIRTNLGLYEKGWGSEGDFIIRSAAIFCGFGAVGLGRGLLISVQCYLVQDEDPYSIIPAHLISVGKYVLLPDCWCCRLLLDVAGVVAAL